MSIGLRLAEAKANFFDRQKVIDATDRAERTALSRFGAFVRTRARTSIRQRKKVSEPGKPPSSHTGLLKQWILFAYEALQRTVVIGPILLSGRWGERRLQLLEYGGYTGKRLKSGRTQHMHYLARPFMRPAFDAELSKAAATWKSLVRE